MEKLIIIKYAELSTKKENIGLFLNALKKNVQKILSNTNTEIKFDKGRMFIYLDNNFSEVVEKLKKVFGIHEISIGYKLSSKSIEDIATDLEELIKNQEFKTFKIETKRSDKNYPLTSPEISKKLGGVVLNSLKDVTVDVHNPEVIINCEIRSDSAYLYFERIKGLGGYPVGTLGKGILMLSGGIDSPVAGYLTMKRGVKLEAIYFESPPHTSEAAKNKVIKLAKILSEYNNDLKLHVINFTEIQESIHKNIPHEYLITIMRRMMYRISAILAKRNNCKILVNGESIGQVASQTLTSMDVINKAVNIPVIRPVACFDKNEIIEVSKKINTYETSILPFEDCCTVFVPPHPIINPELKKVLEYEALIPYEDMIYKAVKEHQTIKINNQNSNNFEELL